MSCDSPQLVLPLNGKAVEIPCGICYKCDVARRVARRNSFIALKSRFRERSYL